MLALATLFFVTAPLAGPALAAPPAAAPAPSAQKLEVPAYQGFVTDLAGILSPEQHKALEDLMESYRAGTTHELALLTIPKLEGDSIERFALEVGRAWKIGQAGANNGALLVVAQDERKLRFEIGRGLEGDLNDAIAGRIIRDIIAPEFRRGDYYNGLRLGLEAAHAAIGGDYGPIERTRGHRRRSGGLAGLIQLLFIGFFIFTAMRRRNRGAGFGGALPYILLGGTGRHTGYSRSGGGGGFGGFGGGGGFSGGGATGGW